MVDLYVITLTLIVLIIGIWLKWRIKRFSLFKELGIPGPEPSIISGNLFDIIKKTHTGCEKEWIQKYGKVYGYYFGTTPILKVADVDLLKNITVKDFQKFADRPPLDPSSTAIIKESLVLARGKQWKKTRNFITPNFTASKMKTFAHLMYAASNSLLDIIDEKAEKGKPFNIYPLYQGIAMDAIGRTAFGIQTDVQKSSDSVLVNAARNVLPSETRSFFTIFTECFPEFNFLFYPLVILMFLIKNRGKNPLQQLRELTKGVIEHRRKDPKNHRQDLLQLLMDAKLSDSDIYNISDENLAGSVDGKDEKKEGNQIKNGTDKTHFMTNEQLVDNSILFLLAGYETTSTALAFTTHLLVNNLEIQDKVRDEVEEVLQNYEKLDYNSVQQLKYLEQVMMESLRLYPPVTLFTSREALEDIQYGKYKIIKGLTVEVAVCYINRDPDLWENPDEFNPDRFSVENKSKMHSMAFQSFGVGPRNCVGARFAQLEIKLVLAKILHKYRLTPADETEMGKISIRFSPTIQNPAKGVMLKAIPA